MDFNTDPAQVIKSANQDEVIDGTPGDLNRSQIQTYPEKKDEPETKKEKKRLKLPFSHDLSDISRGLKVNTLIIKICRLDFNK